MPRTRDLSASRRQLLQAWCRKTIKAAQQATLLLLLILALSSCRSEPNSKNNTTPEEMISVDALDDTNSNPSAPYTLSVESVAKLTTGFHSFVFGTYDDYWIVLGGRVNGFHGTEGREATFPRSLANDSVYLINSTTLMEGGKPEIHSAILPPSLNASLSATNMGFEQMGNYLFTIGGYGSTCPDTSTADECYQTFPHLTRIDLNALSQGILNNRTAPEDAFVQLTDEYFRVAGGEMYILGETFYVVFGQDYPGIYKPGRTGNYTEQIRTFKIDGDLKITDRRNITDPSGNSGANSEFHRRDLNVVPAVRSDGSVGLDVYGGVFNAEDEAFPHPIVINGSNAKVNSAELKVGLYECGQVILYDRAADKMYTSLLGGIGAYRYSNGKLVADPDLPFTRTISTVTHDNKSGEISEYIQSFDQSLFSWIGANAVFFPAAGIPTVSGHPEIIDYDALSGNGPVVLGHMIGGIHANGPQTAGPVGSYADNNVYAVTLHR